LTQIDFDNVFKEFVKFDYFKMDEKKKVFENKKNWATDIKKFLIFNRSIYL
jgi:hypothetical protein